MDGNEEESRPWGQTIICPFRAPRGERGSSNDKNLSKRPIKSDWRGASLGQVPIGLENTLENIISKIGHLFF